MRQTKDVCSAQPLSLLDAAQLRRSLSTLLIAGGALGMLWIFLAESDGAAKIAVIVTVSTVFALAAWIVFDRNRHPRVVLTTVLLLCGVLITVEIGFTGPAASPFPLFYIWLLPWSFLLWDFRRAGAYVGTIALVYGALLVAAAPDLEQFGRVVAPAWLIGMGGVAAVGWVLRVVCDRLLERHHAAARAAHSQYLLTEFARRALADFDVDRSLCDDGAAAALGALSADAVEVLWSVDGRFVRTGVAGHDGPPTALEHTCDIAIDSASGPAGLLRITRRARPLGDDELVFARSIAEVLALATTRAAGERRRLEQAGNDAVTGLAGRERFAGRLCDALAQGGTLLLLDLDDFGLVNETLGPRAGDMLLCGVAQRLRGVVAPEVMLARVGGDEFAVFDPGIESEVAAVDLARQLQRGLAAPFDVAEAQHHVSVSVGILACAAGAYADDRVAIRDAHVALRRAKEVGRGRFEMFNAEARAALERRRLLEQELRLALERREFRLVYQPIVELERGGIVGAEALVRWQHPTRGLVAPGEFIEVAEASDLILPLGGWVLREALRQLKAWSSTIADFGEFRLNINLSGRQLADPAFPVTVQRLLRMHDIDPGRITFELTETAFADESAHVECVVDALRELGILLALDDFGSGYASLSYVRRFAFDSLKLDRSFIAGLGGADLDAALIEAAIAMGRALGMKVVAEGVETAEQSAALRALGCGLGQGFLFARPMDAAALRAFVERGAATPA